MINRSYRKSETGIAAGWVVLIIGALMVLYLLLIPPTDRWQILNEWNSQNGAINHSSGSTKVLLRENPGIIIPEGNTYQYKNLQAVELYTSTMGEELLAINSLIVSRSVFRNNYQEFTFNTHGQEPDNVYLGFNIVDGRGLMTIYLNGKIVSQQEFTKGSVRPILLPKQYIDRYRDNLVRIELSSPKAAFWRLNYYDLRDIKIVANLIDTTGGHSDRTFTAKDIGIIDEATLKFQTRCDNPQMLGVALNGKTIYHQETKCFRNIEVALDPKDFVEGVNTLSFTANDKIVLDFLKIIFKYKEPERTRYYFEINENQFENETLNGHLWLVLRFPEKDVRHRLTVIINAHKLSVDTYKDIYERDISDYALPGTNSIILDSDEKIDVQEVRIDLDS